MRLSLRPELPPGPRSRLATLHRWTRDPWAALEHYRRLYGPIFTIRLPGTPPLVHVSSPEAVREVVALSHDEAWAANDIVDFLLGSRSLLFIRGREHARVRSLMGGPFTGRSLRAYAPLMAAIADEVIDEWPEGDVITMSEEMQKIALRVILRCVFGVRGAERAAAFERLLVDYLGAMMEPWVFTSSLLMGPGRMRGLLEAIARLAGSSRGSSVPLVRQGRLRGALDAMIFEEIARCRREGWGGRDDFLALLVSARGEDGAGLDDETLRDHLVTMLIGGHETTATSLCWAVRAILDHGLQAPLRAEVEATLGPELDPTRVRELRLLGSTLHESMRRYPIAVGFARVLDRPCTLEGHALAAGTTVVVATYVVHHDPERYPAPGEFRADRFVDQRPSPISFTPFGGGQWRCLGAAFAELEMRVVLSRLLARVELELAELTPLHPQMRGFTVAPAGGVKARIASRRPRRSPRYLAGGALAAAAP